MPNCIFSFKGLHVLSFYLHMSLPNSLLLDKILLLFLFLFFKIFSSSDLGRCLDNGVDALHGGSPSLAGFWSEFSSQFGSQEVDQDLGQVLHFGIHCKIDKFLVQSFLLTSFSGHSKFEKLLLTSKWARVVPRPLCWLAKSTSWAFKASGFPMQPINSDNLVSTLTDKV